MLGSFARHAYVDDTALTKLKILVLKKLKKRRLIKIHRLDGKPTHPKVMAQVRNPALTETKSSAWNVA